MSLKWIGTQGPPDHPLERRISASEQKRDDQEQYSQRTSICIAGIKEELGNVSAKVKKLFSDVDVNPAFNKVHCVGPPHSQPKPGSNGPKPKPKPRAILCSYMNHPDKASVISKRMTVRQSHPSVFINEDLMQARAKVLYHAWNKKNHHLTSDTWSDDGHIIIRYLSTRSTNYITSCMNLTSGNPTM